MLENKKFGMISLGCDKNRVDAERLLHELLETTGVTYTPGTKTKVTRALNAYEASKK